MARNFRFSHGIKRIVISDTNLGIMAAWREAWSWRDQEMFIVIEDDVEMSVMWYRALVNMWTAFGDRWQLNIKLNRGSIRSSPQVMVEVYLIEYRLSN